MTGSPLEIHTMFTIGPVPISSPVVTTWGVMAFLVIVFFILTRKLSVKAGNTQAVLEILVTSITSQIRDTLERDPRPFQPLIGTLFIFILAANWSDIIPRVEPPTAHIETDAALAFMVFMATPYFGIKLSGPLGYLKTFAEPSWVMIPLNFIEQITRNFALMVRLFGNVMSGVFVIAVVLSLAGLLVPIPLMALDLLTGAVQAYIFAILAIVFIGSAIADDTVKTNQTQPSKEI